MAVPDTLGSPAALASAQQPGGGGLSVSRVTLRALTKAPHITQGSGRAF